MQPYRRLDVWNAAHALTLAVYEATDRFPDRERFGLTAQLRRSVSSTAANIAEACGRTAPGSFGNFLEIACGSASETEYHLLLAKDLGYLPSALHASLEAEIQRVRRMLAGLVKRVRRSTHRARTRSLS
jgi:four helix bundle protein